MLRILAPLLLAFAPLGSFPSAGYSQLSDLPSAPDRITRQAVVQRLAELFREEYASPNIGRQVSDTLVGRLERGEYDVHSDGSALAAKLSSDLLEVTRDKHLQVFYSAEPRAWVLPPNESPEERGRRQAEAHHAGRNDNFGFPEVRILAGNVGYLRLSRLMPPEFSGQSATAAMNLLANSDALIIDLRSTGGGHYNTAALVVSYLVGTEPVHLATIHHREGERKEQLWTLSHVPGPRLLSQPVYVLVSERTFSAPEHIAYDLQALGRANVVGERTGGGALPGRTFAISPHFAAWISTGVPISAVTGTNWEGKGIEPDIAVPAERALLRAHSEAARKTAASVSDSSERRALIWIAEHRQAEAEPTLVPDSLSRCYAGQYGPRTVTFKEEALFYQRSGGPSYRLIPLTRDLFALEGLDTFRIRFVRDGKGRVVSLVGMNVSGVTDSNRRSHSNEGRCVP